MNYFENKLMRAGMADGMFDNVTNAPVDDEMIIDGIIRLKARDALTTKIDLSVAYAALAQKRREERDRVEAEIREYLDSLDYEEWEESLCCENDSSIFDEVWATRRNTGKNRKKSKRVEHRNRRTLEKAGYDIEAFNNRRVLSNNARRSEIEGKNVYKTIGHKAPRRNPELIGRIGNRAYWNTLM